MVGRRERCKVCLGFTSLRKLTEALAVKVQDEFGWVPQEWVPWILRYVAT